MIKDNFFAQLIKETRTRKGFSQSELSKKTKILQATLSAWETGRQLPQVTRKKDISRLSNVLGIPIHELIGSIEEQYQSRKEQRNGLKLEEFLKEQTGFIKSKCQEGLDLWIFDLDLEQYYSPANLVIYNQKTLPEQKIHYHIPLPFDWIKSEIQIHHLERIVGAIRPKVDTDTNSQKITIYPFLMSDKNESGIKNPNEEYYEITFLSKGETSQVESFCKAYSSNDISSFILDRLSKFLNVNQAVILYLPTSQLTAMSCVNIKNVHTSLYSTEKISNWYFLDKNTTNMFCLIASGIERTFKERRK